MDKEPHEPHETLEKKKLHVIFSAGQYRSTEKSYKYFLLCTYLKILYSQI